MHERLALRGRIRSTSLCLLALALFAWDARAADATDDVKAQYQAGSADYALGHFKPALEHFEAAYKKKPLPLLLFNIAQCHRQLKEFEAAATTYRSFIRLDPNNSQVHLAQDLLAQVEAALRAQNQAQAAPPLDANGTDAVARTKPEPLLEPKPEAKPEPKVAVTTPPAHAPLAAVSAPAQPPERKRLVSWIALGAGGAALGAGAVFGLMSKSTANDLSNTQHTRAQADDLQSKLSSQAGTANILFIAGAALAVAGGALFVLHY